MKTKLNALFIGLALLAGVYQATAQAAQFFRIVGPTAVTITAFRADGTLVWSGATPGATYTVQISTTLAGGVNWVDYDQLVAGGSVSTNLIVSFNLPAGMTLIPAGVFTMGDTLDGENDAIPINVTVSAFYMDVNLVSLSQWQGVYSYATSHGYSFVNAGMGKAVNHPVQTVDWYDCVKWCNARSQQAGLTPVYYTDAGFTRVFTNGDSGTTAVYANWRTNGYRLPTEAEWEKAARGGLIGQRFPWGNTISWSQANYSGIPCRLIRMVSPTICPRRLIMIRRFLVEIKGIIPTQVRWDHFRRTDMGYMTWRGMYWSGVGIGMGLRMVNQQLLIQPDRPQAWKTCVCYAAALGTTTPPSRAVPLATTTTSRTPPTTATGSVV